MNNEELVYIGIKGKVLALARKTGEIRWSTTLTAGFLGGGGFVHLVLDEENLYATTQGEITCLDTKTGKIRWQNGLRGYGVGIATIATRNSTDITTAAAIQESEAAAAAMVSMQGH